MSSTTTTPTIPAEAVAAVEVAAAIEKLRTRMTTEYTPIWEVSDFLLDVAAALNTDPLAVAEVHQLLAGLAPSAQRSVVTTADTHTIVTAVRRIAGLGD